MDLTLIAVIIAIFAIVIVAAFLVFRGRSKVRISGPGVKLELDASNDPPLPPPGVVVERTTSRSGGLLVEERDGRGARVSDVEVEDDILVTSAPTPGDSDPKARPPA